MGSKRTFTMLLLAGALAAGCSGGGGGSPGPVTPPVTDPPTGDPRLDLAASVSAPSSANAGETLTVQYAVRNVGSLPATWVAELRFGAATTPFTALALVNRAFGTSAVAPGASATGTFQVPLAASLAEGDYQIALKVSAGQDGHPDNDLGAAAVHVRGAPCVDDAYEEDDLASVARSLPLGGDVSRNFCFDPADWGSFQARAGEQFGLRLVGEGEPIAVSIAAGADTLPLATVATESPGVAVAGRFTAPADGTYLAYAHPRSAAYGVGRGYRLAILPARSDPTPIALYNESFYAPPVGGVADVRLDLRNDGFDMPEPVTVEFVLSKDTVLDAADRRIDRQTFPAMAGDTWEYRSFLVPVPPDVTPGDWYLIAVVDPDDLLPEIVETNNVSPAMSLMLVAPECPGDAFEEDDRPADARPIEHKLPQRRNFCEDGHDWARFDAIAGEAFTLEALPDYNPQDVSLRVLAPSGAVVAEATDYRDTILTFTAAETGAYRVEVGTQLFGTFEDYTLTLTLAQPDLTAEALPATSALVPGGVVGIRADYQNFAPTPAGPFQIAFFLSRDERLDPSDVRLVPDVSIAGVADRFHHGGPEVPMGIPADVGTGAWFLLAMADPDGLVAELDETNNVGPAWSVQVSAPLCAPDAYEQDDTPAQARPLPLGTPQARNHCDDRRDWVTVPVTAGDPLAVRLDQSSFSGFDVGIYAEDGRTRLAGGWNGGFWRADRTGNVLICAGCEDAPATSAPASYRLTADLCPPDSNEPDDAVAGARPIAAPGSVTLNQCDGSDDWLVFDAVAGSRYTLSVSSPNAAARPSAGFYDSTGYPMPTTRGELSATVSGKVWIKVTPPMTKTFLESAYTLSLSVR